MNKKFLSAILFGALIAGSTGTFTSCKDYDDDIKDLQGQLDKKASLDELNSKVTALETSINGAKADAAAAKTKAEEALTKAQEALDKAGQGGSSTEIEALKAALEKAQSDLQKQIDKLASLEDVTAKVAELKKELQADFVTDEKLQALSTKVQALTDEVVKLIGHRLTSLAVIPTTHINGIAAITFTTLQYTPQSYQVVADHKNPTEHVGAVLDHVGNGSAVRYISTEKNKAYFHVSPSVGVSTQDIKLPSFDGIKSENIITRNAAGVAITNNKPIEVTGYNIDKEGVLEVTFKKEKSFLNTQLNTVNPTGSKESFYMASLKAPIAEANYTEDEAKDLAAGTIDGVYVNSEYARIEELIKVPYLTNMRTNYSKATTGNFADEIQNDGNGDFYVHYHDSICLYKSDANSLIDVYQAYDKALDLKKLVKVCVTDAGATDHKAHEGLDNYKEYGLTFRFRLANAAYIPQSDNVNKTDQQKFAEIDSPINGMMKSKVYNIPESATAVGREPIVCVTLIDSLNGNALIAQRYIKVKWTMEGKTLNVPFAPRLFDCTVKNLVDTEMMNTLIYDKAKEGGMTKNEFHSIYTEFVEGTGTGTAKDLKDPEAGVESHNIEWTLSTTDLGAFWPGQQEKTFTKTVTYKDPKGINADITVVMTRTIYMPALNVWGHMGTYWKGDKEYKIFNINPIVYGTKESNPAWNTNAGNVTNPTCNIYTDLLNGFLDDRYKKPTEGAAGVVYYTDKNVASKKFYYPDFGPLQTGATMGANSNGIYYEDLGVRFVFDKARIGNYKYTWKDGKQYTATLSADQTQLFINGQLAATIVNRVGNLLNTAEMTYNIKLEEAQPNHGVADLTNQPTEAAKALVGELVPINLVADLCGNGVNVATVKEYEANIIEPLTVKKGDIENFIDAKNEGSTIDVTDAFTYYSWNDNKQIVANTTGLPKALYDFYQVREAAWPLMADGVTLDVTKIKTNLKGEGGNLEPSEDYDQGSLPANVEIKYEKKTIDGKLRDVLTYYNYSGTPVNKPYKLFIPVEYGYKWKTLINVYEVTVAPNSGTPGTK